MREEEPGWSRSEWALWWLDHDEVDEAARALEPGDALTITKVDFRDLAAALNRRGLVAVYEDGQAFVYTREQAPQAEPVVAGERRPPRSNPAAPVTAAKRSA
jgi:hypothetical protein